MAGLLNVELVFGILLILFIPYGWVSCVRIIRFSKTDPTFNSAERWKQTTVRAYYWFGAITGPFVFVGVLYVFYLKFIA